MKPIELSSMGFKFEYLNILALGIAMNYPTKVLNGVPFLVDTANKVIYAYEKPVSANPLRLGTYNAENETFQLVENWKELYQPRLEAHRAAEKPRSRLPLLAQQQKTNTTR